MKAYEWYSRDDAPGTELLSAKKIIHLSTFKKPLHKCFNSKEAVQSYK